MVNKNMQKENKIEVRENDMFIFVSSQVRYALGRDNHLAPGTAAELVRRYLPLFSAERKKGLIELLIGDIKFDLKMFKREQKHVWLELLDFLRGE